MHTCAALLLSQTQKLFPVTEERIQSDRSHFQAEAQLPGGGGGMEMPKQEKWEGRLNSLLCVCPYSALLPAVDRTNISGVPTEAASVPVGGLNRFTCREAPRRTDPPSDNTAAAERVGSASNRALHIFL